MGKVCVAAILDCNFSKPCEMIDMEIGTASLQLTTKDDLSFRIDPWSGGGDRRSTCKWSSGFAATLKYARRTVTTDRSPQPVKQNWPNKSNRDKYIQCRWLDYWSAWSTWRGVGQGGAVSLAGRIISVGLGVRGASGMIAGGKFVRVMEM